jgi:hypothetical protein
MIASDAILSQRDNLPQADLNPDLILIDPQSGNYFVLTGTARAAWDLLMTPMTMAGLCDALVRRYRVDAYTCQQDLQRFLGDLEGRKLLHVGTPAPL